MLNIEVETEFCEFCKGKISLDIHENCNSEEIDKWNYQNNLEKYEGESYHLIMFDPKEDHLRSYGKYDSQDGFNTKNSYHKNVYEDMTYTFTNKSSYNNADKFIVYFETVKREINFFPFIPTKGQKRRVAKIEEINELKRQLREKELELGGE